MERTKLLEARKAKNWSQAEVAKRVGISASHYAMIEAGTRTPSLPLAFLISEAFGIPVEQLFFALQSHSECDSARDQQAAEAGGD